jgi:hypothetical protein
MNRNRQPAAIGLSISTGHAVVVIVGGMATAPRIAVRFNMHLADRWVQESLHPFHHELGNSGQEARQARRRGSNAARLASRRAIRSLVSDMKLHGLEPIGAAIVVPSLSDPSKITRAHPRAHAEELKLYRESVAGTLTECGIRIVTLLEKNVRSVSAKGLGQTQERLSATLKLFSHEVGTPWRAPEKYAALGAWLTLAQTPFDPSHDPVQ